MARRGTKVTGVAKLVRKFRTLTDRLAGQATREGVDETTKSILKDARSHVAQDTKLLKKSLGRKVKTYRKKLVQVGVVGVRKHMRGKRGQRVRTDKWRIRVGTDAQGKAIYQDPIKYAHLVERGARPHSLGKGDRLARQGRKHQQVQAGRRHPGSKKQPFLRPALDRNRTSFRGNLVRSLKGEMRRAKER